MTTSNIFCAVLTNSGVMQLHDLRAMNNQGSADVYKISPERFNIVTPLKALRNRVFVPLNNKFQIAMTVVDDDLMTKKYDTSIYGHQLPSSLELGAVKQLVISPTGTVMMLGLKGNVFVETHVGFVFEKYKEITHINVSADGKQFVAVQPTGKVTIASFSQIGRMSDSSYGAEAPDNYVRDVVFGSNGDSHSGALVLLKNGEVRAISKEGAVLPVQLNGLVQAIGRWRCQTRNDEFICVTGDAIYLYRNENDNPVDYVVRNDNNIVTFVMGSPDGKYIVCVARHTNIQNNSFIYVYDFSPEQRQQTNASARLVFSLPLNEDVQAADLVVL